jgi:hypothetical protein
MDTSISFENKINELDVSLFDAIESQTTEDDRRSLLAVQRAVRSRGEYVYLEIGSHLGGTLQPYLVDPLCTKIYSIDARPKVVDDARGERQTYKDNSTDRMMRLLSEVFPEGVKKIKTIDASTENVDPGVIDLKPTLCFIDGEHTDRAVVADFDFCVRVTTTDRSVVFHDSDLVYRGVKQILRTLSAQGAEHEALKLGGSVFAIAFGDSPLQTDGELRKMLRSVRYHFVRSPVRVGLNRYRRKRRSSKSASVY